MSQHHKGSIFWSLFILFVGTVVGAFFFEKNAQTNRTLRSPEVIAHPVCVTVKGSKGVNGGGDGGDATICSDASGAIIAVGGAGGSGK